MKMIEGIPVCGEPDAETVKQMQAAMSHGAVYGALMADHHLGYSVPVGGVIAYEKAICVNGVGYDIACGNKAVQLDCDPEYLKGNIYRTMNEIKKHISFGMGRKNSETVDHELFDDPIWTEIELLKGLKDKAVAQLGTVGSGNHYVDIFIDDLNVPWIGVHFGSRGLGHSIATHFVKQAGGKDGIHAEPVILGEDTDLGQQYLKCMELAGRYAYAGRDWVCKRVAQLVRANITAEVHNHHNFAWRETHFDRELLVVRKGATPAWPGQKGFVGGSMGDKSYIIEGLHSPLSEQLLYSTIHGAGRSMGRMQAKGKYDRRGNCIREGLVSKEAMREWITRMGVEVRGGDIDEAPQCYKRIDEVLESHTETIRVVRTLTPIGVCMADSRDYDPYKD